MSHGQILFLSVGCCGLGVLALYGPVGYRVGAYVLLAIALFFLAAATCVSAATCSRVRTCCR